MAFFAKGLFKLRSLVVVSVLLKFLGVAAPGMSQTLPAFVSLDRTVRQYENALGDAPGDQIVVADNGGIAYYAWDHLSQRINLLGGAMAGDTVRVRWRTPSGQLIDYKGAFTWDADNGCWQDPSGLASECWSPRFSPAYLTTHKEVGDWRLEVVVNDEVVYMEPFYMQGFLLEQQGVPSRTGEEGTTISSPLSVKVLDPVDMSPIAGETVRFAIATSTPGSGFGLSSVFTDPPSFNAPAMRLITTGADGVANVFVELGEGTGNFEVEASSDSAAVPAGQPPIRFAIDVSERAVSEVPVGLDPRKNLGLVRSGQCVGNPINVVSGNKFERAVDFVGRSANPIAMERYYNSQASSEGTLGYRWRHGYERSIRFYKTGKGKSADHFAELHRPDGRVVTLKRVEGIWRGDGDVRIRLRSDGRNFELVGEDDTTETYDSKGRLIAIADVRGNTLAMQYTKKLISSVTSNTGERLQLSYNSENLLEYWDYRAADGVASRRWYLSYRTATLPTGREVFLLESLIQPSGYTLRYHYEDAFHPAALTGVTDENGERRSTWRYDLEGFAVSSYNGTVLANRVFIDYVSGTDREVSDSKGNVTHYEALAQVGQGLVAATRGPDCAAGGSALVSREYDPVTNDLTSEIIDGLRRDYGGYDAKGNPGHQTVAPGSTLQRRVDYRYDARFKSRMAEVIEPSVFDAKTKSSQMTYDASGNLVARRVRGFQPDGSVVTRSENFSYEGPYGQLSSIDGPLPGDGDRTLLEYYPDDPAEGANRGMLKRLTGPGGIVERDDIQYNEIRRVSSELRPNGLAVTYDWNLATERLLAVTVSGGSTSRSMRWSYHPNGTLASVTGHGKGELTFDYDDARRLIRIGDLLGNAREFTLDSEGNVVKESVYGAAGVLLGSLTRTFDEYSRIDTKTRANEHQDLDYSGDGTLRRFVDGRGAETQYSYDEMKRLITRTEDAFGSDPATAMNRTHLSYDEAGNLSSVTSPNGAATTFARDDLGNLIVELSSDRGRLEHRYDAAGNRIYTLDANGREEFRGYDDRSRLTFIDRAGTEHDVVFTYDTCENGVGRLCSAARGDNQLRYSYNAFGQVTALGQIVDTGSGPRGATLHMLYDSGGRLEALAYPDGKALRYGYDARGNVVSMDLVEAGSSTPLLRNAEFSPFGVPLRLTRGNGTVRNTEFDLAFRIVAVNDANYGVALTRDANGNVTARRQGGQQQNFSYDLLDRLINAADANNSYSFVYDRNGNRLSSNGNGGHRGLSYESASNRLATVEGMPVTLDANGNMLSISGLSLEYSPDNRLVAANGIARYSYNALGQRIHKSLGFSDVIFIYDLAGRLVAELDGSGNVLRQFYYHAGSLFAGTDSESKASGLLYFVENDHLGTPQVYTNMEGEVIGGVASQSPFGISQMLDWTDPSGEVSTPVVNHRFPGQYFDAETGLHYNYFRDYDPSLGRYIQSDPIGLGGGLNSFIYAEQNPLRYVDERGLRPTKNPKKFGQPIVFSCQQNCMTNFIGTSLLAGGVGYGLGYLAGGSMAAMTAVHTASSANSAFGYFDLGNCLKQCSAEEDREEDIEKCD